MPDDVGERYLVIPLWLGKAPKRIRQPLLEVFLRHRSECPPGIVHTLESPPVFCQNIVNPEIEVDTRPLIRLGENISVYEYSRWFCPRASVTQRSTSLSIKVSKC